VFTLRDEGENTIFNSTYVQEDSRGEVVQVTIWAMVALIWGLAPVATAQELPDTLAKAADSSSVTKESAILYVIPAGPVAGSFTEASRIQIVDTVAGWAKVLLEGWVPVEKVLPRMTDEAASFQFVQPEKVKKAKSERPRCIAMTSKGKQCSRQSMVGNKKCWQHSQ